MDISITEKIDKRDEEELVKHINDYNYTAAGSKPGELGVFLRDDSDHIIAGLIGHTWGKWLFIKTLWVDEAFRGSGLGSRILAVAEDKAVEKGCKFSFLDTFCFQAPLFYPKMGYKESATLDECPSEGKRIYFTKKLAACC